MGLVDRLIADDESKIPVHDFMAAMAELSRGEANRADVIAMFNLVGDDVIQLDALIAKAQAMVAKDRFKYALEVHDVLLLAESGLRYTTTSEIRTRLGV